VSSLREIYASVPATTCKGLCTDQCTVIPIAKVEREAIEKLTGRRVKTLPQVDNLVMRTADDGSCRYLRRGRCSIYQVRPLICRLYGAAVGLECQHGCRPVAGLLSRDAAGDLIGRLMQLRSER